MTGYAARDPVHVYLWLASRPPGREPAVIRRGNITGTATKDRSAGDCLGLRYAVCLRELSAEEGGGWTATIRELGPKTFVGDGATAEEALADLEARKWRLIPELLT
jgi:hypothetical protein